MNTVLVNFTQKSFLFFFFFEDSEKWTKNRKEIKIKEGGSEKQAMGLVGFNGLFLL